MEYGISANPDMPFYINLMIALSLPPGAKAFNFDIQKPCFTTDLCQTTGLQEMKNKQLYR
jgi:hypothetical protein